MAGLFVQKHVEAVRAQGVDVRVIDAQDWIGLMRQWRTIRRSGWRPNLVQLNVIQKQGLLALWLKRHAHIPYIIIEHWSGYLPENGQFRSFAALKQQLYRRIAAEAEAVMTVSPMLEQAMQQLGFQARQWLRAKNVVDEFFYEEGERREARGESQKSRVESQKTLLHVSCFDERAKNVFGLLRAFRVVCKRRDDVRLVLVGIGPDWQAARDLADELDFPKDSILFTGEQTPHQVCEWFRRADAFVLSSRYETAAIVLCEAAATGTPILSTPVGLATEIVTPETGLLVSCEIAEHNPRRFAEHMECVLNISRYPSRATEYRFEAVGRELKQI